MHKMNSKLRRDNFFSNTIGMEQYKKIGMIAVFTNNDKILNYFNGVH